MLDLEAVFEKFDSDHEDEFLRFERIEHKLSRRPDIHAFLLLDKLVPGDRDMVAGAKHDEISLDVEVEELAKVATEEDIRDLVRCGVMLDGGSYLSMFV